MSTETSSTYAASSGESKQSIWPMFFIGLFLIALFFFAVRLLILWNPVVDEGELERAAQRIKNLEDLQKENEQQLTTYGWVDKEKGEVRIPIERAMALQIAVLNSQEIRPAYPVNPPVEEEVPAPATEETSAAETPVAAEQTTPAEGASQDSEPSAVPAAAENENPTGEAAP